MQGSEEDARFFLMAIDSSLIEHLGHGRYRAALSSGFEQFFWEGQRVLEPRPFTLWLEPVITVAGLVRSIRAGESDVAAAESELDWIYEIVSPYPRWLQFSAPALLAMSVTILFGGSVLDALATLGIGIVIQPDLERIERSALPLFFQVVFGVSATALLVVILASLPVAIDSSLVLTGGLLRFLPGAQLVAGMRDLIARWAWHLAMSSCQPTSAIAFQKRSEGLGTFEVSWDELESAMGRKRTLAD